MQRGFFFWSSFFQSSFFQSSFFQKKKKRREAVCGSCAEVRIAAAVLLQQKKGNQIICFFGYTFTERFSYSDQIQRTVFG